MMVARPDLASPRAQSIAELAERAASSTSSRMALDTLTAWQRRVAVALAASPDDTSTRRLAALLQTERQPVEAAISHLFALGLAWGDAAGARVTAGVRQVLGPFPAGLAPASPMPMTDADIDAALSSGGPEVRALLDRLVWELPIGQVRDADRRGTGNTAADRALALKLLRPREAHTVILPREVSLRLRGGRLFEHPIATSVPGWPAASENPSSTTIERAGLGSAFELLRQVERVIDRIGAQPLRPLASGGIARRDAAALAQLVGDADLAAFVVTLARQAGLLAASGPEWLPTTAYDQWASSEGWARWQRLRDAWTRLSAWPGSGALLAPGTTHSWAAPLRSLTAAQLRAAVLGTLIEVSRLAERIAWTRPSFDHEELADQAEQVLREAGWLGLTALGRRTGLLDAVTDPGFPQPVEHFLIQSDLTAVAPGPLTRDVAEVFGVIAASESTGGAGVHRFTSESIRAALDAGWTADELRTWIERHSSTGVPQPLTYLIDDVARRHGAVQVAAVSAVVTIDDPATAEALLSDPRAKGLGLRRISGTVLGALAEPDEVVALLRSLGHAPVARDASGELAHTPVSRRAKSAADVTVTTPDARERDAALTRLAEELLARIDPSVFAKASDDILEVLRRYQGSETWLDLDFVSDDGTPRSQPVRVMGVAAGNVRLQPKAAQAITLPLSRVVGVRVPRRMAQG